MALVPIKRFRKALGLPSELLIALIENSSLPLQIVDGKVMVNDSDIEILKALSALSSFKASLYEAESDLYNEALREKIAQEVASFIHSCLDEAWERAVALRQKSCK